MIGAQTKTIEILLAEDNEGDVLLAKIALKEAKIQNTLSIAKDGEEALDYLYKRNGFENAKVPDLIFLDLNMPKKGGREVLDEIKSNETLKHIPVVILTSSQAEQDLVKTYDLNSSSYVIKPVNLEKFIGIVNAIDHFGFSIVTIPEAQNS